MAALTAEMAANVWKVLVEAGAEVQDGDVIMILESMKMEIPVYSEESGRVIELCVSEGDAIEEGMTLAVIG